MFTNDKPVRIPKEFTLLGHKYTVVFKPDLLETEGLYGDVDDDMHVIRLQSPGPAKKKSETNDGKVGLVDMVVTNELLIETFFHEVIHAILDATGEERLSKNERFVNMMGKSMLEIYLSSVYEKEDSK